MTVPMKRWYRLRRIQVIILILFVLLAMYCLLGDYNVSTKSIKDLDLTRRSSILEYIEATLEEALKEDKGTGCDMPKLDPFSKEITQFDIPFKKVKCEGENWVRCWMSECKVTQRILDTKHDIKCTYKDILYRSDDLYDIGPPTTLTDLQVYTLTNSDHVKVYCTAKNKNGFSIFADSWSGNLLGIRTRTNPLPPPDNKQDTINVLILGFDSTAKNGFIRRMPKSYRVLKEKLDAVILNSYNVLGDGTPASLFPILTGKTELELPESRKSIKGSGHNDAMPFIFYKLRANGYRTAYYEDMPWIGTFQYRFRGFKRRPADHYLRDFYMEEFDGGKKWYKGKDSRYCVGNTPTYLLMLNITDQFFRLDGKKFAFTFIADITHDGNMIGTADGDLAKFLLDFKNQGRLKDTLLFVMGDHGPRFSDVRNTLQGKMEERLPLMAVVLPETLKMDRPEALTNLRSNVDTLTTPHDIHATILDALDMQSFMNPYKVQGADLARGLSLLDQIPKSRSCSEAGIETHWCACLRWNNVVIDDLIYKRVANVLLEHINFVTEFVRPKCVLRTLTSIQWVMRQIPNKKLLTFQGAADKDGYVAKYKGDGTTSAYDNYQVKIVVGPGEGMYEGSVKHMKSEDKLTINPKAISRTNAYNEEPSCISAEYPHLNMFCYCKNQNPYS